MSANTERRNKHHAKILVNPLLFKAKSKHFRVGENRKNQCMFSTKVSADGYQLKAEHLVNSRS